MSPLLRVETLSKSFGGLVVAADIDLALAAGDRVALIGPNGAGKTTFVNLVTGVLAPSSGRIFLGEEEVTRLSDIERARRGLVRSFQVTRLFRDMTAREHLELAILQRERRTGGLLSDIAAMHDVAAEVEALLEALNLDPVAESRAAEIAYGQQRMLEIALALALKPKVLLLDEPAAGVAQSEIPRILATLEALPRDIAVLMIEHDMDLVFRFASRVAVLAGGRLIFTGTPGEIAADPQVREAYLGSYRV